MRNMKSRADIHGQTAATSSQQEISELKHALDFPSPSSRSTCFLPTALTGWHLSCRAQAGCCYAHTHPFPDRISLRNRERVRSLLIWKTYSLKQCHCRYVLATATVLLDCAQHKDHQYTPHLNTALTLQTMPERQTILTRIYRHFRTLLWGISQQDPTDLTVVVRHDVVRRASKESRALQPSQHDHFCHRRSKHSHVSLRRIVHLPLVECTVTLSRPSNLTK